MSEANEDQGFFARRWAAIRRLSGPAKAAWLFAFVLLLLTIFVWTLFVFDPTHVPWRHAMTWPRILLVVALIIVIPPLLYWCLWLWLEGDPSKYPDIDFAFNAGVTALQRQGISLDSAPIYLILGASSEEFEKSFIASSGRSLRVRGEPEGPAALHWHANPDGIFLFCSEAGWLTALNARVAKHGVGRGGGGRGGGGGPSVPRALQSTYQPSQAPAPQRPAAQRPPASPQSAPQPQGASPASQEAGGTIMLEQFLSPNAAQEATQPAPQPRENIGGTMTFDTPAAAEPETEPAPSARPGAGAAAPGHLRSEAGEPVEVDPQDVVEQLQRLEYLGRLLRRKRRPLCPVNGALVLLPFALIEGEIEGAQLLQRAVKSDLAALQRSLQLLCPVTALVMGMEREAGFRELMRRVGRERAAAQRFGQRFDVRALATVEQMAALCVHVCGAFEDWIYTLFREEGALSRPGNTRLYGLLCKVRCNLQGPLMEVLAGAFGHDPQTAMTDEPTRFSGCYFAATGASAERQAFVRGIFDKLNEEQEDLEWTGDAMRRARRTRRLATAMFGISGLLVAGLIIAAVGRWAM